MSDFVGPAYAAAERALLIGNIPAAVQHLREVLTHAPEEPMAHALLASCLLSMKRRFAARHEAEIALNLDPMSAFTHHILGHIALAELDLAMAKLSFEEAIALEPEISDFRVSMGQYLRAKSDFAGALYHAEKAVELDPGDGDALVFRARVLLDLQRIDEAEAFARDVLAENAEHIDALTLLGEVHFKRGRLEDARDTALWALQTDANNPEALELLANIKMRENPLLGLWWRYNNAMASLGLEKGILILVVAFVFYFLARTFLLNHGQETAAEVLNGVWLVLVLYTWIGEAVRTHLVKKELEKVRLKADF